MSRIVLVAVLALGAATSALAQGKIAVLDVQGAILNTDVAQQRLKSLREQKEFKANLGEVEQLQKDHNDLVAKLKKDSAVMSQEQIQEATKKISEKRNDIEHVARKLQAAEKQLVQEVVQELAPKLQQVVTKMIEDEKIGLILDAKATLHAAADYNITDKVTDKINQAK